MNCDYLDYPMLNESKHQYFLFYYKNHCLAYENQI